LAPSNGAVEHTDETALTSKADDVSETGEPNGEVPATHEDVQEKEAVADD